MGKIILKNINIYAHHGCFLEETKIGSEYKLDIWLEGDFSQAENTDNLNETVDYVEVSDIAVQEMAKPSKLIEHVADRILSRILLKFSKTEKVGLVIKKLAPPMNVYAESVQYRLEKTR